MTKRGVYQDLFKQINTQLEAPSIIVKQGSLVDASVIDTYFKPNGKPNYEIAEDREEVERSAEELTKERVSKVLKEQVQFGVDTNGGKKAGRQRLSV